MFEVSALPGHAPPEPNMRQFYFAEDATFQLCNINGLIPQIAA
jgi:hypothetical protein